MWPSQKAPKGAGELVLYLDFDGTMRIAFGTHNVDPASKRRPNMRCSSMRHCMKHCWPRIRKFALF